MDVPHDVYTTDVLVIGGGLAGCWAAIAATRQGAARWWWIRDLSAVPAVACLQAAWCYT